MKILAIVGSPRLKGNTNFLVDQTLAEAGKLGADTEKIVLGQYGLKPCLGHDDCAAYKSCLQKDDAAWILSKLLEADGVILATPVYWYNVTAQMKAFIDRNYFLYEHAQKSQARAVGIIVMADSEGIKDTLHTLNRFIDGSFDVARDRRFTVTGYAGKSGEVASNLPLIEEARKLGRNLVETLREHN